MLRKYPRTFHVPWSDSNSRDDLFWKNCDHLIGKEIVVTEKMDGECSTLYGCSDEHPNGYYHARSLDTRHHWSRTYVKVILDRIAPDIPQDFRICAENLTAHHSIYYEGLPGYLYVFGIYNGDTCLSWDETIEYCDLLSLHNAPVLYRGEWNEEKTKSLWTGKGTYPTFEDAKGKIVDAEGYVVRLAGEFNIKDFATSVGKYVRENHVQTDTHWMTKAVIKNRLKD